MFLYVLYHPTTYLTELTCFFLSRVMSIFCMQIQVYLQLPRGNPGTVFRLNFFFLFSIIDLRIMTNILTSSLFLYLLCCLLCQLQRCLSLRDHGAHPLVVDYHEHYMYKHLGDKMTESLSVNNCTMGGSYMSGLADNQNPDIVVTLLPPPQKVIEKWMPQQKHQSPLRLFYQITDNICSSQKFREVSKGFYARAKGCYSVYVVNREGKRVKRINDYGATLHPEHTRCNFRILRSVCHQGNHAGIQMIDKTFRELGSFPFKVEAKNVLVSRSGMFALPCGPFGLFSSCEAVKWGLSTVANVSSHVHLCRKGQCPYPIYDKVFVMTQYDDTQIGQFMQEAFPKLIYHLDYLLAHPEVKIHYSFTKRATLPTFVLPHNFFAAFGLLDRLINGTIYAKEIIMPREGGCQDIGYNAWEVVTMRETFYRHLHIPETTQFVWKKPASLLPRTILLLTRSAYKFTQNKADYAKRSWSPQQERVLVAALQRMFPDNPVEIFSDRNETLMTCPLCQAEMFTRAEIVIGYHGAGLSNAMFMKPGGVMVEVVYHYDSRHAPIIGIFPRICDIIGLHHFSYYVKDITLNVTQLAEEIHDFHQKVKLWSPTS
jgi:hypothetical protein